MGRRNHLFFKPLVQRFEKYNIDSQLTEELSKGSVVSLEVKNVQVTEPRARQDVDPFLGVSVVLKGTRRVYSVVVFCIDRRIVVKEGLSAGSFSTDFLIGFLVYFLGLLV